jgi:parallel beta-helix repeat protein
MNTKSAFMILLILILPTASCCFAEMAESAKVWTVDDDGPADFQSIQEAVDAADSGDTVFVHSGIYVEAVSINKTISLVGENPFDTIVDADYSSPTTIHIHAQNVTISNLTAQNSMYYQWYGWHSTGGIYLAGSTGCAVENCIVTGNQNGINLQRSSGNRVYNNLVTGNEFGIEIGQSSSDNLIEGNWVLNNSWYGMGLGFFTYNNTVVENSLFDIMTVTSPVAGVVHHNNFLGNPCIHVDAGLSDFDLAWFSDGEGNFWNNYTGLDENGDGIGDTPYAIQYLWFDDTIPGMSHGTTNDSCPLMRPYVWIEGDVSYDMKVNIVDIALIAKTYGSQFGDPDWSPRCDLNSDSIIDILDIAAAAHNFGKQMTWPPA